MSLCNHLGYDSDYLYMYDIAWPDGLYLQFPRRLAAHILRR